MEITAIEVKEVDGVKFCRQPKYIVLNIEKGNIDVTYKSFWETASGMMLEEKNNERYYVTGDDFQNWADLPIQIKVNDIWVETTMKDVILGAVNNKLQNEEL